MPHNWIAVRGARVHNLKEVDVDLPRNQLVVITGLSGSGKSSLAFDTLYAEGQRRLAGPGQTGDHHELVPRQIDVDVFQIVYARAADRDPVVSHTAAIL